MRLILAWEALEALLSIFFFVVYFAPRRVPWYGTVSANMKYRVRPRGTWLCSREARHSGSGFGPSTSSEPKTGLKRSIIDMVQAI